MTIEERVKKIIVNAINIEASEIRTESTLESSLGVDSTEMVVILVNLEKEFGIKIPGSDIEKTITVGDVAKYVSNKLQTTD